MNNEHYFCNLNNVNIVLHPLKGKTQCFKAPIIVLCLLFLITDVVNFYGITYMIQSPLNETVHYALLQQQ